MRRTGLLVVASALVLGACTAGSLDEESLARSTAEMARMDVTTGDASIDPARREAVSATDGYRAALRAAVLRSDTVRASVRVLREREAEIDMARSALRPQVTASATAGGIRERTVGARLGGATDISVSRLVFDGGASAAGIDAGTARAFAARAQVLARSNAIGEEAARAWVDVWQFSRRLDLLNERVAEVERVVGTLEQLIASGFIDRASLSAAERQVLDIRMEEEQLVSSLQGARVRFARLMGYTPARLDGPQRLLVQGEPEGLRALWRDAPEVTSAAALLIATERDLEAAQARRRPTVSVRGGVSSPLSETDNPNVNVGLVLSHDFGGGGRRAAEIAALEERVAASRLDFEEGKRTAEQDLEAALARYRAVQRGRARLNEQVEVIESENSTLRSQLSSGQASLGQVVEGEVRLYRARSRQIEMSAEMALIEVGMVALTGQLAARLGIDLDSLL